MNENIKVRFAPSPTGYLHVGGLRTALYNYLFARNNSGTFLLRIEDTDRSRFVDGAVNSLINTLNRVRLSYDDGPYFQSQRTSIYREYADKLLACNAAYHCFCKPEDLDKMRESQRENNLDVRYDGRCRKLSSSDIDDSIKSGTPYVIRAKMPQDGTVEFDDLVRGRISFRWDMVEDQILMKSDGYPTYHLANIVDDHLMAVTHIIRGEEWLTSTPKHIFLYQALGWDVPKYAHLPLLLNPDKSKLSKRQGDVAVEDFLAKGYLPEALVNYVALLGWHSAEDREIYSLSELEKEFSLERINKAGAVFDQEKLKWMNGYYIRNLDDHQLVEKVKPYLEQAGIDITDKTKLYKVVAYAKERINLLPEIVAQTEMFYKDILLDENQRESLDNEKTQAIFKMWAEHFSSSEDTSDQAISQLLKETSQKLEVKGKSLYFPLRLALYGQEHGPNIPVIVQILGKKESIRRLEKQIND